jgi:hypothetical protein
MAEDVTGERTSSVNKPNPTDPAAEEQVLNLIKDGGRRIMYGGNPYEDDLELAAPFGVEGVNAPNDPGG